ncbi:HYALURONAN MEDIATED MOTILITY RECEPTOR-LIKE PROTEIN [Salix purpurea]|uniref:HYALURONAN MEDIATED MOTILITY RECEPTOR-LIKE PROTEIN n=2 Tax=Salix TaxID=40685 RepID=A0A9Q0ZTC6_9ROSI|nr:HYALURONAN MEDIATED MOTILITY RECEPTOR-LIKE PROTEIN [Salix purpurea]KAJ6745991.1 HYALURONAN MEDIATED MOTILITY RECEPTOR-LIKE PROTEIN [Salix koriyanagi]
MKCYFLQPPFKAELGQFPLINLVQIIISQERNIHKLNELVQSLQEQLQQCRSENYVLNSTAIPLTEHFNELKQQPILDD